MAGVPGLEVEVLTFTLLRKTRQKGDCLALLVLTDQSRETVLGLFTFCIAERLQIEMSFPIGPADAAFTMNTVCSIAGTLPLILRDRRPVNREIMLEINQIKCNLSQAPNTTGVDLTVKCLLTSH